MEIKVAAKQMNEPHKCKICGKFIAWRDLGKSAVKESDRYLAEFVHIACASRRAKTLGKLIKDVKNETA